MNARILKKIRSFRFATAMTVIGLTVLSFQNCAPAQLCADGSANSASCPSKSTDNPSTENKSPNSSGNGSGNNSGGFGSTGGSVSNGSSGGSGNSGTVTIGNGSGGGGSSSGGGFGSGGSSGGSGGSSDTNLKITSQPSSVSVNEFADFQLDVAAYGGTPPYTYQWYKDNTALNAMIGSFYILFDTADTWAKEGNYYVVIKDSAGATVQSNTVRVSVVEPPVGCNAGTYFTFTNSTYDYTGLIPGFIDSPRGKHLLPSGFPNSSIVLGIPGKYTGLATYSFPAVAFGAQATLSCRSNVPRIHTPTKNPQYSSDYSDYSYTDSAYWQYQGSIVFECRNQKLRFVVNTCKWVQVKAFDDNYSGGYNDSPGHGN